METYHLHRFYSYCKNNGNINETNIELQRIQGSLKVTRKPDSTDQKSLHLRRPGDDPSVFHAAVAKVLPVIFTVLLLQCVLAITFGYTALKYGTTHTSPEAINHVGFYL